MRTPKNILLLCLLLPAVIFAQDEKRIQASLTFIPYNMSENESSLYIPISFNYLFNQKWSAGLNIISAELLYNKRDIYYIKQDMDLDYQYAGFSFDESYPGIFGLGINLRYNLLISKYVNIFTQFDANYVQTNYFGTNKEDVLPTLEYEDGNGVIQNFDADDPPWVGHNTMTYNLTFGIEYKISKTIQLFLQYQFFDLSNNLKIKYNVEIYETYYTNSQYYEIDDVKYAEAEDTQEITTLLQMGLRINFLRKKL